MRTASFGPAVSAASSEAAAALGLLVRPLAELDGALAALPGGYLNSADDAVLASTLSDLRLVKDDWEIAQLADAVAATVRGFEDIVRELGAARASSERWIEGTFWRRARVEGNDVGYASIAAAGDHACVLHWTRNDGPVRDGDLLLMDAGVENHALYTADVTRTIPISGRVHRTAAAGVSVGIRGAIGCACGGSAGRAFSGLFRCCARRFGSRLGRLGHLAGQCGRPRRA